MRHEAWSEHQKNLQQQGHMLQLIEEEKCDLTWKSVTYDLPEGFLSFAVRASIDALPTFCNLATWGKRTDDKCKLCGNRNSTTASPFSKDDIRSGTIPSLLKHKVDTLQENIDHSQIDAPVYADLQGMAAIEELTEEIIDNLKDFGMAYPLLVKYDIPMDDVKDLFTAKLVLKRHLQSIKNPGKSAKNAREIVVRLKEEYDKNKMMLQKFYQDTKNHLPDIDQSILNQLEQDNVTSQFQQKIDEAMGMLEDSKCPILVAGETSSGKSSLLNLILGEELLPTSTLSTTSVICEIRYGQERKVKVFTWEGEVIEVPLSDADDDKSSLQKLSEYVHQKGKRDEEDFPYKKAEIFLPIPFLKDGITIVDSPGVGESERMDEVVYDYLQEAFAFIYVINSSNAGGIQKDRLGRLMDVVASKNQHHLNAKHQNGGAGQTFSPQAAIFVCNKWDQVPQQEKDAVQKEQLRVLKRYWPGCNEDQIFQLSTLTASKALHHDVIMDDFRLLLEGIEQFIPATLQRKLHVHYCWLEQFLSRILYKARALEANVADGQFKEKQLSEREKRLRHAKLTGSKIILTMKHKVEERIEEGIKEVGKLLGDPKTKEKATSWSQAEVPLEATLYQLDRLAQREVHLRLQNLIMDWEEETGFFKETKSELEDMFHRALVKLEKVIENAEHNLTDKNTEVFDKQSDDDNSAMGVEMRQRNLGMFIAQKAIGVMSSFWVPLGYLKALLQTPALRFVDIVSMMENFKAHRKNAEQKEPRRQLAYLQKRSEKVLEKFKESTHLRKYVTAQMEQVQHVVDSCEGTINDIIESNKQMVLRLRQDDRTSDEVQLALGQFKAMINHIHDDLCMFGAQHVRTFDYEATQISREEEPIVNSSFSNIYKGKLTTRKYNDRVTVKSYIGTSEWNANYMVSEEKCLRGLRHQNIIQLMGTARAKQNGIPMLILEDMRQPIRMRFTGCKRHLPNPVVQGHLIDIGEGLKYLHKKGMVHLILSLDTVVEAADGKVKLTNACTPRNLMEPEDTDDLPKELMYLSPMVLQGAMYDQAADMYSLGLMMWEMWSKKSISIPPSHTLTLAALKTGVVKQNLPSPSVPAPGENWEHLMNACLDPYNKMSSTDWLCELRKYGHEETEV
ncbi:uncharacterized protein LOC144875471 [Branchiostoma floridae x Branchiostoma japonicum]